MPIIPCMGQSEARGCNRWFHLAAAELTLFTHGHAEEVRFCLDLYSRRRGRSAPVILVLTAAEATALAQGIQEAVKPLAPALLCRCRIPAVPSARRRSTWPTPPPWSKARSWCRMPRALPVERVGTMSTPTAAQSGTTPEP